MVVVAADVDIFVVGDVSCGDVGKNFVERNSVDGFDVMVVGVVDTVVAVAINYCVVERDSVERKCVDDVDRVDVEGAAAVHMVVHPITMTLTHVRLLHES